MVARIATGESIRGALEYNEQKVDAGVASLLLAANFSCEVMDLSLREKLRRFEKLTQLNPKVATNTMHLSLNFPADEKLDSETLQAIASFYMQRLGFGDQPYLVYKHDDIKRSHLHIVTTNVQANGRYISMHNIGKLRSEPARKTVEIEFGLVKAEERKHGQAVSAEIDQLTIAHYGDSETKQTISDIVRQVTRSYKFGSLEELNAVLRQRNVVAVPRHSKSGRSGLVYSIVDRNGHKAGVAINASDLPSGPTLARLERVFEKNIHKKAVLSSVIEKRVLNALMRSDGAGDFINRLYRLKMACCVHYDASGKPTAVYFVDHRTRSVFNAAEWSLTPAFIASSLGTSKAPIQHRTSKKASPQVLFFGYVLAQLSKLLLQQLFHEHYTGPELAPELLRRKKKKKHR